MTPFGVQWCTICAQRPAEGMLEVLNKDSMETDFWPCCRDCVNNLNSQDWIENTL